MGEISASYLIDIRNAARVDISDFDDEIETLILAAREELRLAGVKAEKCNDETDPQIKRAVIVFVRAEFGIENADREKYLQAFESIKLRLSLSVEYKEAQS
nr:MAG TPA: head to tail adaptor [Caudoviricetes sp.]